MINHHNNTSTKYSQHVVECSNSTLTIRKITGISTVRVPILVTDCFTYTMKISHRICETVGYQDKNLLCRDKTVSYQYRNSCSGDMTIGYRYRNSHRGDKTVDYQYRNRQGGYKTIGCQSSNSHRR